MLGLNERSECKRDSAQPSSNERSGRSARPEGRSHKQCKRDSAQPSIVNDVLRQGFQLAHHRLRLIYLDLVWKSIWLVLTLAGLFLVAMWFGAEFRSTVWADTGNRAVSGAITVALLRRFWLAKHAAILAAVASVLFLSLVAWFLVEAGVRSKLFTSHGQGFSAFLVSSCLKSFFILAAVLALAAICFGRYFATPFSEWPQLWPDTRGAAFVGVVAITTLGFFLTILDTLVRNDAIELLGTDLFRVTGLIAILLLFEKMIFASCAMMLGIGLLKVAGLKGAVAILVATATAVGSLNVLHSYLLLVRYLAVGILRQNAVEI